MRLAGPAGQKAAQALVSGPRVRRALRRPCPPVPSGLPPPRLQPGYHPPAPARRRAPRRRNRALATPPTATRPPPRRGTVATLAALTVAAPRCPCPRPAASRRWAARSNEGSTQRWKARPLTDFTPPRARPSDHTWSRPRPARPPPAAARVAERRAGGVDLGTDVCSRWRATRAAAGSRAPST